MQAERSISGVDDPMAVDGAGDDSDSENELKFDFSCHIKEAQPDEELAKAPRPVSATLPFTHSYLGELKDVTYSHPPVLFTPETYRLPIFIHISVVFPGQFVPMWIQPPIAQRLLAVVNKTDRLAGYIVMGRHPDVENPVMTDGYRACISRVLQISDDGQRALLQGICTCTFPELSTTDPFGDLHSIHYFHERLVLACPDTCPDSGDPARSRLDHLAKLALQDYQHNHPLVARINGDPVQISYRLAANLPLSPMLNLLLVQKPAEALLEAIPRLSSYCRVLKCNVCDAELAQGEDLIQVVDEGPCPICVNPGGYAHKMICLRDLRGGVLVGAPSTEASWFPGYAWQMVQCACEEVHLGWLFTALESGLPVKKFWGLSNYALAPDYQVPAELL